jgi:energy-coupling factor transporter ATP-binding protein EcfA2
MNADHTLLCGDSGGGKTTLMREMHQTFDGVSIWINHNSERVPGRSVSTINDLREAVRSGTRRLNFEVNTGAALTAVEAARSVAYHVVDNRTQIVVDEAHNLLPDGDVDADNPLKQSLHEDRSEGVRVVVATQDPSDLEYTPIKQCKYFTWVGGWSVFHDGFIRYFNIPRDDLPTEPYQYVVFDKRMSVVTRNETKERYA